MCNFAHHAMAPLVYLKQGVIEAGQGAGFEGERGAGRVGRALGQVPPF